MIDKINALEKIAEQNLEEADIANDLFHIKLALNAAKIMCEKENADFGIVRAALLIHHISPRRTKNHRISDYRTESFDEGKEILTKLEFSQEVMDKILNCVEATYFGKEQKARSLEAKVAHDANKLVTIGALGIARAFTFGGAFKRPIFDAEKGYVKSKSDITSENSFEYDPFSLEPDTVSHFKTKLLKIEENMLTQTGKKMGLKRHMFMIEFLYELFDEIDLKE